ncbi:MAG: DHH family phosphoesterase, partial [Chitinophagaceae bacterium]
MQDKRWTIQPFDNTKALSLTSSLHVKDIYGQLLVLRDIDSFEDAKKFFRPEFSHLHDPFLMKDMEKAVQRIDAAIHNKEKILIYGDYDVDGTTAVSITYSFLKEYYDHVGYYVPHRYREGYGISFAGIDYARENNYSLIITLDCGIKAIEKISYANSLNIEVI